MMMTINNNVALPILLSVRGFCFLVFLLFIYLFRNGLPSDVTSAWSLSVFKNRLKTYLFGR